VKKLLVPIQNGDPASTPQACELIQPQPVPTRLKLKMMIPPT
jgi:hypothetical protein